MKSHRKSCLVHALWRRAFVLVIFASLSAASAFAQRIPTNVVPAHYTLALTPGLKTATFSGVETIEVNLKQSTNAITLNAAEITFQSVTVTANGATQTGIVSLDAGKEQATFTFPQAIPAGSATLDIRYTGILNNELRGFYLSKTAKRNYAVTQFESTDARRAFPCFDEPAFKATFSVSLTIDAGDTAISNGPGNLPQRRACLSCRARIRQRDCRRFLECANCHQRQTGRQDHGVADCATR